MKKWINSVQKISLISENDKKHIFLRKTVLGFEKQDSYGRTEGDGVQYIAVRDCLNQKHVGPSWRKTSIFSRSQFHDGFLYGIEDEYGELTGV